MNEQNIRNRWQKFSTVIVLILLLLTTVTTIYLFVTVNDLKRQIQNLESEKQVLRDEIDRLAAPKLVDNLSWIDNDHSVNIFGEVWNVGGNGDFISGVGDAYYCRLHVILYREDVVVKDTYIKIGDNVGHIAPEHYDVVDAIIYYNGDPITKVKITPEIGTWE